MRNVSLRAFLRQDPDVVMVGEIRDKETAQIAMEAAMTGHLVFSTIHTNDAPSAVARLHEMGVPSIALNIALPHEQGANPYVTPTLSFKFHYFALRKMHFMMRAKALVSFPGGFGTFDELFEILTLVQTRKSQRVPIVLFGTDYWRKVLNFEFMVEEGVIAADDLQLFHLVDTPEAAWQAILDFYGLDGLCPV